MPRSSARMSIRISRNRVRGRHTRHRSAIRRVVRTDPGSGIRKNIRSNRGLCGTRRSERVHYAPLWLRRALQPRRPVTPSTLLPTSKPCSVIVKAHNPLSWLLSRIL